MKNQDFIGLYREYTNHELLKIIRDAGDYQPSAVAAARELLTQRGISNIDSAAKSIKVIADDGMAKEKIINKPSADTALPEWSYFLFAVIVIVSLYTLFTTINSFNETFKSKYDDKSITLIMVVQPLLILLMFILLLQRKWWGWAICFGLFLFKLTAVFLSFVLSYRILREYNMIGNTILFALLYLAICVGLTRKQLLSYFFLSGNNINYAIAFAVILLSIFFAGTA
jgi:hypothetical protein